MQYTSKLGIYIVGFFVALFAILLNVSTASAQYINGAKISFTFDDGYNSTYDQAAPILAKYGYSGTVYVVTNCVGMTTAPNTCRADEDATYMTWDQILSLQNTYGWEIGSHTVTHPYLATKSAQDGQPKKLTTTQVLTEITNSQATLVENGVNSIGFAAPYGDYNQYSLTQIAKLYAYNRGYADTGTNLTPYNNYIIRDQEVRVGVSIDTVKGYIDDAIAKNEWLVLTFHDVLPTASGNPDDYQYSTADFEAIVAYVNSRGLAVVNVDKGLVSGDNLLTNSSFDSGISDGWSTDSPANVTFDTSNNGSYPSSTNSILAKASTVNSHLFAPMVAVTNKTSYIIKNFINISTITSGCVGYYIDEYDINGNWISGQYKLSVSFPWSQTVGFIYTPSSENVANAQLQVIISANSGITAYLDNFQWINENPEIIPVTPEEPEVPEEPETPIEAINLIDNGDFEAGFGEWSTDGSEYVTLDTSNNGSSVTPTNSIKMTATNTNRHLFAPKTATNIGITYKISVYVNIIQLTSGEIGFYMDEYDTNGNWVSGKYITGVREVGATTVTFDYTPTSTNVASTSLQIILVGNSGITAYIDDVVLAAKQ